MDSVTHLATGMVMGFAKPWLPRQTNLALTLPLALLITSLPDFDVFFTRGLMGMLVDHRGLSHSIVALFGMALALGIIIYWASYKLRPRPKFIELFAFCLFGLGIHVMLDCLTAFGTQILLPFSNYRFSLPIIYIVDLWWTIPLLTVGTYCVLTALRMKAVSISALAYIALLLLVVVLFTPTPLPEAKIFFPMSLVIFWTLLTPLAIALPMRLGNHISSYKVAWAGMLWIFLYPTIAFGISLHVKSNLLQRLGADLTAQQNGLTPAFVRTEVLAEPFSPLNWKVLAEDQQHIYMVGFSFLSPGDPLEIEKLPRPAPKFWEELAASSPLMSAYTHFIEFPALLESRPLGLREGATEKDRDVIVLDMRYRTTVPKVLAAFGRSASNFSFELRLNAADKPIAFRLLGRRAQDQGWHPLNQ